MTSVSVHALKTYADILQLMKRIERSKHYILYSDLIEEAKRQGFNPEFIDQYINKLKRIGTIYSPRPGVFRFAD